MNAFKKIGSIATALLTTMSLATGLSAYATSYYDPYDNNGYSNYFDSPWYGNNDYVRIKINSTSIYVKNESNYGTNVSVYARNTKYGADKSCSGPCTYNGQVLGPYTTTGLYLGPNLERQIRQVIFEQGDHYAHIYFYGNANAYGKWSPDSYGTYPTLN